MRRSLVMWLACALLASIAARPGAAAAAGSGDFVTIGLHPPNTDDDTAVLRGTAPRDRVLLVAVNGEERARVAAHSDMDVYNVQVPLDYGRNQLVVRLEGGSATAEATIVRSFADLRGHWAQQDVDTLVGLGVVNGVGSGSFGPEQELTRAQFAKLMVLALGLEPAETATLPFTDADAMPDWAKGYVAVAVQQGLIKGYEDGTFRPDDPVTRAQVAVIAARGLRDFKHVVPGGQALKFSDQAAIPAWAAADIDLVTRAGLIEHRFWGERFEQSRPATRAEAAAVIRRLWSAR